jgi:uncharacterized protein with PQ loop repeat
MTDALHHFHRRKRIHQGHEPYPHPDRRKRFMDRMIYVAGALAPLVGIFQAHQIWASQNAAGVSLFSWSLFALFALIWMIYGVMHKEKPIILTYAMWIVVDIFIVSGILMYG